MLASNLVRQDKDGSNEIVAPENSTEAAESRRIVIRRVGGSTAHSVYEAVAVCGPSQVIDFYSLIPLQINPKLKIRT